MICAHIYMFAGPVMPNHATKKGEVSPYSRRKGKVDVGHRVDVLECCNALPLWNR